MARGHLLNSHREEGFAPFERIERRRSAARTFGRRFPDLTDFFARQRHRVTQHLDWVEEKIEDRRDELDPNRGPVICVDSFDIEVRR